MLASLTQVKTYLGINDDSSNSVLTQLLGQTDKAIKSYLCRDIESASYTHLFNGDLETELLLKQYPVTELTSFKYNSGTMGTPVRTSFDRESYNLDPDSGILHLGFLLNQGVQNIQVIYKAGFTTIPKDLEMACIKLTSYFFKTSNSDGIRSEGVDGATISYEKAGTTGWPADIMMTLDIYKKFYV